MKKIFNGIINTIFPKDEIEKKADIRREKCRFCFYGRGAKICKKCKCVIELKIRSEDRCPLGFW